MLLKTTEFIVIYIPFMSWNRRDCILCCWKTSKVSRQDSHQLLRVPHSAQLRIMRFIWMWTLNARSRRTSDPNILCFFLKVWVRFSQLVSVENEKLGKSSTLVKPNILFFQMVTLASSTILLNYRISRAYRVVKQWWILVALKVDMH